MKKLEDFKLKKGDKVKFKFIHPSLGVQEFEGIFNNYSIIDDRDYIKTFGPRNIKKAKSIMAEVIHTNVHGIKIKFPIWNIDLDENLIQKI
jgi:hypothetical protein